jgi:hypothetical protein
MMRTQAGGSWSEPSPEIAHHLEGFHSSKILKYQERATKDVKKLLLFDEDFPNPKLVPLEPFAFG